MPHLTLEYTANSTDKTVFTELFAKLHKVLAEITGIKIENCKSRAYKAEDYYVSDGTTNESYVHLEVRFIEGRDEELKKKTGEALLESLKSFFDTEENIQISVEILDIRRVEYFKYPELNQ